MSKKINASQETNEIKARRDFLKTSAVMSSSLMTRLGSNLGLSGLLTGISNASFAAEQNPTLQPSPMIVVFLRGGADGLALLSPLDDPNFLASRPPEMRFAIDKSANTALNLPALNLDGTNFYWHPAATSLANLFNKKRLIAWQAVGIQDETRSHFEAQEMIERGLQSLQSIPDPFGWMARQVYLNKNLTGRASQATNQASNAAAPYKQLPLFAGSNTMPRAMQGASQVLAVRDLQGGVSFPGGPAALKAMQALGEVDSNHPAAQAMLGTFNTLEQVNLALPKTDNKVLPYVSAGATPYPDSDPGAGLRSVARLMQINLGLQYAWVDHNGWDTHDNQPGRVNYLTNQLGNALQTFDEDMQAQNRNYTLIVMTEFGRRLITNKSNGSDHGHGGLALVMGSKVPGGKTMGKWPGLATNQLDRGVDLAVTTDYLKILQQAQAWNNG